MSGTRGLFKKIDSKVFDLANKIKSSAFYVGYLGKIETLPDEQQSFINQFISLMVVTLPLLLLAILSFQVYTYKKEISTFLKVTSEANKVIAYKNEISSYSRRLINSKELSDQASFERELRAIISGVGIKAQDVNVLSFTVSNTTSEISRIDVSVSFKQLTSKQMTDFLNSLTLREKMKVLAINIKKDEEKSQLSGQYDLVYFLKGSQ